ncbi:hypothetical protein BDV41DRAFT_528053 [Aspergillus transmontanensis]|uniref:Uncharacterized protein n=1 Tax=Aspergillus transmontanensis TaxID=1034304 RepID=A0A5N6W7D4_9EURO|nr:hypothetical protein BDV41DRAFT_528053 [Aspergillus transmontanensis]
MLFKEGHRVLSIMGLLLTLSDPGWRRSVRWINVLENLNRQIPLQQANYCKTLATQCWETPLRA